MTGYLRYIAVVATLVLAAVVGVLVFESRDGGVAAESPIASSVPSSMPSVPPSPNVDGTASPSGGPSPATATLADIGPLAAGRYVSVVFEPRLRFTIRAGWALRDDEERSFVLQRVVPVAEAPSDVTGVYCPSGPDDDWGARCSLDNTTIVVQLDPVLASDVGDCEGRAQIGAPTSLEGLLTAIAADPRFETDSHDDVTIGELKGEELIVGLSPDWTGTCKWSDGKPAAMLLTVPDPPGPIFGLKGGERYRLTVLDLGGRLIAITYREGWRLDIEPIVETFRFAPD